MWPQAEWGPLTPNVKHLTSKKCMNITFEFAFQFFLSFICYLSFQNARYFMKKI